MLNRIRNILLFKKVCHQKWKTSVITQINFNNNFTFTDVACERHRKIKIEKHELYENEYFYRILMSNKRYRDTIAFLDNINEVEHSLDANTILNNDLTNTPLHVFVEYMKTVLHQFKNCSEKLDDPVFLKFSERLKNKIPDCTNENLLNLLKVLTLWPQSKRNDLFYELCKTLDEELVKRRQLLLRNKIILFMDHLYRLGVIKYSDFFWRSVKKIFNESRNVSPQELIHVIFLINSHRRWHPSINMFNLEMVLLSIIYDLSVEEVAIVVLAFFKTEKSIRNEELLNLLFKKIEFGVEYVDSITLTAFLKGLRYSSTYKFRQHLIDLLDKVMNRIDDVSLMCCVHMALLGTREKVFHRKSLRKICVRFVKEISSARLKDIERIMFTLELFNFDPQTEPDIFNLVIQELGKREEEILQYPNVFMMTLHYLAIMKIYDYDLLHKAFSEQFLKQVCNIKFHIPPDIIQLSCGVRLECPNYMGNNLEPSVVREISKRLCWKIPSTFEKFTTAKYRITLCAKSVLEEIYNGPEYVHLVYVLPYSNCPDLIICLKDKKPVKIPDTLKSMGKVLNLTPPPSIGDWYVFLYWGLSTTIANTGKPVGSLLSKIRHLKILGYKPLLINSLEWNNPIMNKEAYLKHLIAENY